MSIPGLSTLYSILKRNIDLQNDVLSQRKQLASELRENCKKWAQVLDDVFCKVEGMVDGRDHNSARRAIEEQMGDLYKLDYKFLKEDSPILVFLAQDEKFVAFTESCGDFYSSAINLKRVVYSSIPDSDGNEISLSNNGLSVVRRVWKRDLERMIDHVDEEFMKIKVIMPN